MSITPVNISDLTAETAYQNIKLTFAQKGVFVSFTPHNNGGIYTATVVAEDSTQNEISFDSDSVVYQVSY